MKSEIILLLLGLFLIVLFAVLTSRTKILRLYKKYKLVKNTNNITGVDLSNFIATKYNLNNLSVAVTSQELGDGYHPRSKTLIYSTEVANGHSLASLAIASHELGHAIQDKQNNRLLGLTQILGALTRLTNKFISPAIIIGTTMFVLALLEIINKDLLNISFILIYTALVLFLLNFLVKIITIPLEYDASKKALRFLKDYNLVTKSELRHTKKLLRAAALTYVASLFDGIFFRSKKAKRR